VNASSKTKQEKAGDESATETQSTLEVEMILVKAKLLVPSVNMITNVQLTRPPKLTSSLPRRRLNKSVEHGVTRSKRGSE
jgi:hypothetical protein